MKKLLLTLALFALVATSRAVDITYIQTNDYIGNSRDTINDNFSNMLASVHASASNSVVVTFTQMSSNWYYWVSNSVDGGISYWLGCNTNGSGGADGNTPQGPWTNDVAGAGFALTGADYVQATNQAFFVVGTNILAMQGWPDATNVALNGQSLINPGGGSTDWKTRGITNSFEGFACAKIACASNQLSANTWTQIKPITNVTTDLIYDTGTNYGFASGFFNETNCTWQMPKGSFLTTGAHTDGAGGGGREMWMALWVNGQPLTNYNSMPIHNAGGEYSDVYSTLSQSGYAAANAGIFLVTWSKMFYNTTATNIWELRIRDGGANYDYSCWLEVRYMGDQR